MDATKSAEVSDFFTNCTRGEPIDDTVLETAISDLKKAILLHGGDEVQRILVERPQAAAHATHSCYGGSSPLELALRRGNKHIISLLLQHGKPCHCAKSIPLILSAAINVGFTNVVDALLTEAARCYPDELLAAFKPFRDRLNPLYCAVKNGHIEILRLLLAAGARADIELNSLSPGVFEHEIVPMTNAGARYMSDYERKTPLLHVAIACGRCEGEIFTLLLRGGADLDAVGVFCGAFCSAWEFALLYKNAAAVTRILQHYIELRLPVPSVKGASMSEWYNHFTLFRHIDDSSYIQQLRQFRTCAWIVVYLASQNIGSEFQESLADVVASACSFGSGLDRGVCVEPSPQDIDALRRIIPADFIASTDIITILEKTSFVDVEDAIEHVKRLQTAVIQHVAYGLSPSSKLRFLRKLLGSSRSPDTLVGIALSFNIDINACDDTSGMSLLHTAVKASKCTQMMQLLEHGADVNGRDKSGSSPLHHAGLLPVPLLQLLIDRGADVNQKDNDGQTPLSVFWPSSYTQIRTLIRAGARADATDKDGQSQLHKVQSPAMVDYLLSHGVDINATDNAGNTPLLCAYAGKPLEIVFKLLECGANVNIRNAKYNLLHLIASDSKSTASKFSTVGVYCGRSMTLLEALLQCGGDPTIAAADGDTVVAVAATTGHPEVLFAMLTHGFDLAELITPSSRTATYSSLQALKKIAAMLLASGKSAVDVGVFFHRFGIFPNSYVRYEL